MKSTSYSIDDLYISIVFNIDDDFELNLKLYNTFKCDYSIVDISDSNFVLISGKDKSISELNRDVNLKFIDYKFNIKQRTTNEIIISNYVVSDDYTHRTVVLFGDNKFDSVFEISKEDAVFLEEDNGCSLV